MFLRATLVKIDLNLESTNDVIQKWLGDLNDEISCKLIWPKIC
jgi:hypothetical protein